MTGGVGVCVCAGGAGQMQIFFAIHLLFSSKLPNDNCQTVSKAEKNSKQNKPAAAQTLQAQTLANEAPPISKIDPFSKIAVTYEPVMGFGCPSRISLKNGTQSIFRLKAPSATVRAWQHCKDIFTNHDLINRVFVEQPLALPGSAKYSHRAITQETVASRLNPKPFQDNLTDLDNFSSTEPESCWLLLTSLCLFHPPGIISFSSMVSLTRPGCSWVFAAFL